MAAYSVAIPAWRECLSLEVFEAGRQQGFRSLDARRTIYRYWFHAITCPFPFAFRPAMIPSLVIGCSRMRTPQAL